MLKKHKPLPEDDNNIEPELIADYAAEQAKILGVDNPDPVVQAQEVSPEETAIDVQALIDEVTKNVKKENKRQIKAKQEEAMGAVDPSEYTKAHPGVTHFPSSDNKAYAGPMNPKQRGELVERLQARTATPEDMALIDESMLMDLPYIKASDFSIPGQYDPKPKDPSIRFRWVNCVNALQSNMQRFLTLGYEPATVDDVDQDKSPLAKNMIDGTQIKQYDVLLMKIPVMQLMALYKKNIMDSAYKLDSVSSGKMAEAAAGQAFNDLVSNESGARSGYNKVRAASGREPVTFSRT
jgi:hypothetical protein